MSIDIALVLALLTQPSLGETFISSEVFLYHGCKNCDIDESISAGLHEISAFVF